jgi:uncharacterized membrane protein
MSDVLPASSGTPVVRTIGFADLQFAFSQGFRDFRRAPVFGLVISGLFVLGGIVIYLQLTIWDGAWMILPLAVGFPLIGPFIVVGLYEVSHQLEDGNTPTWQGVLGRIFTQRKRQIPSIAFIVTFFFGIWFYLAHLVFALFFGLSAMTNISSSYEVLWSQQGLVMLTVGTLVGAVLSFVLYSISVVSFPLLVDREVDFVTGMIISFSAVLQNFPVMIFWALIVGFLTILAMLPMFLGLLVVLPVLGHATWHLYRRVLEPMATD